MSSLNLNRACSTKHTGSPGSPSAPGTVISYWLMTGRIRWRMTKRSCWLGSMSIVVTLTFRRTRRSAARRPLEAGGLVGGAPGLVDVAFDQQPVAQAPEPAGRGVDHTPDAPGIDPSGAHDGVAVDLDVLVGLGAQLLPDARDVVHVRAQPRVPAVGLRPACEAAGRRGELDLGIGERDE